LLRTYSDIIKTVKPENPFFPVSAF